MTKNILADLVNVLNAYEGRAGLISNQGQAMDGFSALANFVSVAKRARDAGGGDFISALQYELAAAKAIIAKCPDCPNIPPLYLP